MIGGVSQLGVSLIGDAIGGVSPVIVLLGADALVGIAGAVMAIRWRKIAAAVMLAAGLGAVVALFGTSLLEIGVAALLLQGAAATLWGVSVRR